MAPRWPEDGQKPVQGASLLSVAPSFFLSRIANVEGEMKGQSPWLGHRFRHQYSTSLGREQGIHGPLKAAESTSAFILTAHSVTFVCAACWPFPWRQSAELLMPHGALCERTVTDGSSIRGQPPCRSGEPTG